MLKYKVLMEITISDTDAPPIDWLPPAIKNLLEDNETISIIECEVIPCL